MVSIYFFVMAFDYIVLVEQDYVSNLNVQNHAVSIRFCYFNFMVHIRMNFVRFYYVVKIKIKYDVRRSMEKKV